MYHFLLKARLSAQTWANFIDQPEDRLKKSKQGAAEFGGEHLGYWYCDGNHDVYSLFAAPDVLTAPAMQSRLFSSGAFDDFQSVLLLTVDQMKDAIAMADSWPSLIRYTKPGDGTEGDRHD